MVSSLVEAYVRRSFLAVRGGKLVSSAGMLVTSGQP